MKKKNVYLLMIVLVILFAGAGLIYQQYSDKISVGFGESSETENDQNSDSEEEVAGDGESMVLPAPEFPALDYDGNEVSLADFEGTPVVLNFWYTGCYYCKEEMPHFQKAFEKYGDQIQFMMLDTPNGSQETIEMAKEFIEESGYTFPVYFDINLNAATAYGISGYPTTFFINADGTVAAYYPGMLDEEILQKGIDMLLEE